MTAQTRVRTIVLTGASGFIGSALAAKLIAAEPDDHYVMLSRHDADGAKTREAIASALRQEGADPVLADAIAVVPYPETLPGGGLRKLEGLHADELWHVAAHMSYEPAELPQSIQVNAVESAALQHVFESVGRYYYISTTGVAGLGHADVDGVVPEQLLVNYEAVNPYTVSKVLAEYMLWKQSEQTGVPLTILRPGSVIGHSVTGWAGRSRYGYYSYLHVLKKFIRKSITFELDVDPHRTFPVIHIDHFTSLCDRLRSRTAAMPDQEIYHAINQNLMTAAQHFQLFEQVSGGALRIGFGPGTIGFNITYNKMNADNNRFMGVYWTYAMDRLAEQLGEDGLPPALSGQSLTAVFQGYLNEGAQAAEAAAAREAQGADV
ncbi:Male sterility domain protein [Paenibacillus curdlanolyticus YK9]|uniref:Male sterility domain protein n=1 Tax=Paenibacillus curdlanolyticus YK9 TaxID=717606 RepID=E0I8M6_9BACL|nr:SDR family oxidoreductase [Paenibacillus curdlanolyticus]EFM11531.1 Male sterility domain protein [Paenibacillus curdlanolyticus YK9]